uniref:X-LRR protein n=1 Tax=Manihot esculenta TaxID=3983 RepID=Q5XNQ3_MANES|nr:X-LRR protein [Manihot esculenta]
MIMALDHFSKWAKAEAVQSITTQQAISFVSKNIFIRFGIPKVIITDNGTQFASSKFKDFCRKWDIDLRFSSTYHP